MWDPIAQTGMEVDKGYLCLSLQLHRPDLMSEVRFHGSLMSSPTEA